MPQAVLPPIPVAEAWTPMPVAAAEPEKEAPEAAWSPVPESAAVEDTYFSDVAFLGDSRTEGFYLYSGLKEGRFFYGVGATVASVFTQNSWKTGSGKKIPLLDALADAECRKVYVMLGVNELGWNKVETFSDSVRKGHRPHPGGPPRCPGGAAIHPAGERGAGGQKDLREQRPHPDL